MAVREFPALGFDPSPGDPGGLSSAAADVTAAGRMFADASANVTKLNSSAWTGDAADAFRGQLKDLPRDLDLAATSHQTAAGTLTDYGSALVGRQRRADDLETRAADLRRREQSAVAEVNRLAGQTAPKDSPEFTRLKNQYDSARSTATSLGSDLQDVIAEARRLQGEHQGAASHAAGTIDNLADAPYKEPGWLSRAWNSVKGWIADHADVLAKISSVLKGVSAVLGVLSLVPGLQFLAPFAMAAGAIALGIDVAVKLATGKGSWTSIGIDAALTFLPGGKILDGLKGVKAAVAGEKGLVAGERALVGGERLLAEGDDAARALESATTDAREAAVAMEKKICEADPIDVVTGKMVMRQVDVELPAALPLVLARAHVSGYRVGRSFGPAWASTVDLRIEPSEAQLRFADDDGTVLIYPAPTSAEPVLPTEGPRLPLTADDEGWTITRPTGEALRFGPSGLLASVTDRLGTSRIEVERSPDGVPTEIRHSGGYRIAVETERGRISSLRLRDGDRWTELVRYGYDDGGRLAAVVNSAGVPLRFRCDDADRIVRWDDRNGTWYSYEFDAAGRCVRTTGADGALSATFDYRPGRTTVTDSVGATKTFEYNELKQVVRETDALGNTTGSEWDRYDRLVSRTDPLGATTRWTYDETGNLLRVERPDGTTTLAEYAGPARPARVTEPDGAVWRYRRDERDLLTEVTDPSGATTRYRYDRDGHLAAVTDALRRTRLVHNDPAGLPIELVDAVGAITRYRRDAFGRVVEVVDPLGAVTRYRWTVEGKLAARTMPDGATETWACDGEGNEVAHTDAAGRVTSTEFGGFDLPIARTTPDGARTEYAYDTESRLITVTTPAGLVWAYDYDPAGRLRAEVDLNGRRLDYAYDAAGRLSELTTAGVGTTTLARDAAGRVVERRSGDWVSTFDYDAAGRIVRAATPDADVRLERDVVGRVVTESIDGRAVTTRYDLLGRRVWRSTPGGAETRWEYGTDDRPAALRAGANLVSFDYDLVGRETERRLGAGAVLSQTWDPGYRLTSQTLTGPAPAGSGPAGPRLLQRRSFAYHPDSTLAAVDDLLAGPRAYDVDAVGRVTAVTAGDATERWDYAPGGLPAAADRDYSGTLLRRSGRFRYEHDEAGRVVLRQHSTLSSGPRTWRYDWNGENRLVGVVTPDRTRWRYCYDAFGRRTAKERLAAGGGVAERVEFAWDGFTLAEQTVAGAATAWDWGADGIRVLTQRELSQDAVDERFYAIVTDLVGTPVELVAPDGTVARSTRTTLWGGTTATGPVDCPLRFPGQYHDAESGLDYNQQRYYDASAARYLSPDPLGLAGGPDPHAYVPNPTGWVDPLGLTPCDPADLFRSMRESGGAPEVGPSARTLGARPGTDIPVDANGMVHPNTGGVSASPGSPSNLPEFRRPPEFGGSGKDPVWTMNERDLPDGLSYRPDPKNPAGHGFLEPSRSMSLSDYQQLLEVTRSGWSRVVAGGG